MNGLPDIPDFDADFSRELMEKMINRFARAGWLQDLSINTSDFFSLHLSERGSAEIRKLSEAIMPFWDIKSGQSKQLPATAQIVALGQVLASHFAALSPPPFSEDESRALVALAVTFGNKNR